MDCSGDIDISAVKKKIATLEGALQKLSEQESKYSAGLDEALKQYAELKEQEGESVEEAKKRPSGDVIFLHFYTGT